jgi:ribosome biogenesis GTPase A
MEKASIILLNEYRDGTLGRISLETPQSRAAMLAAAILPTEPTEPTVPTVETVEEDDNE